TDTARLSLLLTRSHALSVTLSSFSAVARTSSTLSAGTARASLSPRPAPAASSRLVSSRLVSSQPSPSRLSASRASSPSLSGQTQLSRPNPSSFSPRLKASSSTPIPLQVESQEP
ncbi:LOW QUALITY PROTEIN: hypothetical protein PanWU01x14_305810, partial [Parasponia andersonii]